MQKKKLVDEMKQVFRDTPFWAEHTMRVLANAETIAKGEGVSAEMQNIISATAILHDIGAVEAVRKHGSASAKYQELEGPAVARQLLTKCDYPDEVVDRVAFIVGHHHSPEVIDGIDFQIQWEADLLENLHRQKASITPEEMNSRVRANFKTKTGLALAESNLLDP